MNRRDLEKAIEGEVERWPGVSVAFVEGGKHPKAKFEFEGMMLSLPIASTPGDGNSVHITLGQARRTMKQLGAVRDKPEPTPEEDDAPYRKPNDGADKREKPRTSEPVEPEPSLKEKAEAAGLKAPENPWPQSHEIVNVPADDQTPEEVAAEKRAEEIRSIAQSMPDGIYFDLPMEIYLAVEALGSSSIGEIIISPGTFWEGSWLDPVKPEVEEDESTARKIGRAYHVARLEPKRFHDLYCRKLEKSDFGKKLLTSDDKIKAQLKEMGHQQTFSGETTLERAQRCLDAGYDGQIWHIEEAKWLAEIGKREPIPGKTWDKMLRDMERIKAIPAVAEKLTGGEAEVTVIWTDEQGIRCKIRFDYLKPAHWTELKTYANAMGKHVMQAINDAIRYNRYYIAAAHYRDGAEMVRGGTLPIRGPSTDEQRALIEQIQARTEALDCWYIFQEKDGIPNLWARKFRFFAPTPSDEAIAKLEADGANEEHLARARHFQEVARSNPVRSGIYKRALWELALAKETFLAYSQVYEPGEPWAPFDPEGTIDDQDFHPKWLEGGA